MKRKASGFVIEQVIEDVNNIMPSLKLEPRELLIDEPCNIQDIELWERTLERKKIPYVLIYGYIKQPGHGKVDKASKGYLLLLQKSDIFKYFCFDSVEGAIKRTKIVQK